VRTSKSQGGEGNWQRQAVGREEPPLARHRRPIR
jgi:hypothetical protein